MDCWMRSFFISVHNFLIYLLERSFRASYDAFVEKLHTADEDISSDLYVVSQGSRHEFWRSLSSFAIWPFYLTLAGLILLVWCGVTA